MVPVQPGAACHPRSRSHRRGPPPQQRHALSSGACIPFPTTAATTAPPLALQQWRGQLAPLRCRASPRSRSPSRHLRAAANGAAEDTPTHSCLPAAAPKPSGCSSRDRRGKTPKPSGCSSRDRRGKAQAEEFTPAPAPPSCHMHRGVAAGIHLCNPGTHRTTGSARPFCCTRAGQHRWLVAHTFPAIRTAGLHQPG